MTSEVTRVDKSVTTTGVEPVEPVVTAPAEQTTTTTTTTHAQTVHPAQPANVNVNANRSYEGVTEQTSVDVAAPEPGRARCP